MLTVAAVPREGLLYSTSKDTVFCFAFRLFKDNDLHSPLHCSVQCKDWTVTKRLCLLSLQSADDKNEKKWKGFQQSNRGLSEIRGPADNLELCGCA